MLWPTLQTVRDSGGSATIEEINEGAVERMRLDEAQQAVLHGDGPGTKVHYRLAWARSYLKGMGLLDNSTRGVWATTEPGRDATEDQLPELYRAYVARLREERRARTEGEDGDDGPDDGRSWKHDLIERLLALKPDAFERLARRLLREAGFVNTTVTGRSGDEGIDGTGVYRFSLISFPIFFQCKRYSGSVRAGAVRDFRGAMTGRGDKGLLITTGTFTAAAKDEANRAGAPPIDLIDGDRLCDLLKDYALGVTTTVREVEDVELRPEFFEDL